MTNDRFSQNGSIVFEAGEPVEDAVPLGEILARVSREISHLAESIDQFQALISPLLVKGDDVKGAHHDRVFLREIQNFDHVTQKLVCLSEFINALTLQMPKEWRIDPNLASQSLTLTDLSMKLAASNVKAQEQMGNSSGDCELF